MKIYIVTYGDYSDYKIEAVFTKKDLADKFVEQYGDRFYDTPSIEEWDSDPLEKEIREGLNGYDIRMSIAGNVSDDHTELLPPVECERWEMQDLYGLGLCLHVVKNAPDLETVVKGSNELRARLIANNRWVKGVNSDKGE